MIQISLFRPNIELFAAPDDDLAKAEAKEYIKKYGLAGKVKVLRHEGQIKVVTKETVELKEPENDKAAFVKTEIQL